VVQTEIEVLALDIDGVLTDGKYHVLSNDIVMKTFHARDFDAIRRIKNLGISVVLVTNGRHCSKFYAESVGVDYIWVNDQIEDKKEALERYLNKHGFSWSKTLYVGDSSWDMKCLIHSRTGYIPANAEKQLMRQFNWEPEPKLLNTLLCDKKS
jgi:3-deoxy-D-manno-octulosonate 8-phosphate phosphatase (KDO 8-P phosphatase)